MAASLGLRPQENCTYCFFLTLPHCPADPAQPYCSHHCDWWSLFLPASPSCTSHSLNIDVTQVSFLTPFVFFSGGAQTLACICHLLRSHKNSDSRAPTQIWWIRVSRGKDSGICMLNYAAQVILIWVKSHTGEHRPYIFSQGPHLPQSLQKSPLWLFCFVF